MKIKEITVFGYGQISNKNMYFNPGVNIVYGENESGKSTIHSFIRGMFFGFPISKNNLPYRPVSTNSRHGGRITLQFDDKEIEIERLIEKRPSSIFKINGQAAQESDIASILGSLDRQLFNKIFAITLEELYHFQTLTTAEIKDQIFSAGVVGAGKSARAAIEDLEKKKQILYKPRGSNPRLNILRIELNNKISRLKSARQEVRRYEQYCKQELQLKEEIEALTQKLEKLNHQSINSEKLIDAWRVFWATRQDAINVISALPDTSTFSEALCDHINKLRQDLIKCDESASNIATQIESLILQVKDIDYSVELLNRSAQISSLHLKHGSIKNKQEAIAENLQEVREERNRLNLKLEYLGSDWAVDDLKSFQPTLAGLDQIRQWDKILKSYSKQVENLQNEYQQSKHEAQVSGDELRILREELQTFGDPKIFEEIEKRQRRLYEIEQLREEWGEASQTVQSIRAKIEVSNGDAYDALSSMGLSRQSLLLPILLIVGLAIWRGLQYDYLSATVLTVITILLTALWFRKPQAKMVSLGQNDVSITPLSTNNLSTTLKDAQKKTQAIEDSLSVAGEDFGFDKIPTTVQLRLANDELKALSGTRTLYNNTMTEIERAEKKYLALESNVQSTLQGVEHTQSIYDAQVKGWNDWKLNLKVPTSMVPESAIEFFELLQQVFDLFASIEKKEQKLIELEEDVAKYQQAVSELAGEFSFVIPQTVEQAEHVLLELTQRLTEETNKFNAQQNLNLRSKELRLQELDLQRGWDAINQEIESSLFNNNISSISMYLEGQENFLRRRELEKEIQSADAAFLRQFGAGASSDAIRARLDGGDLSTWEREVLDFKEESNRVQEERDAKIANLRDVQNQRTLVEESADIVKIETEIEALHEEIAHVENEWCVLAISEELLTQTLRKFEREHQPHVLMTAGHYFKHITSNRYVRLAQSGEQGLDIIDASEQVVSVEHLSRGTAEQLYMCLRFGLAELLSQRIGRNWPFVLDDVMVNFDPIRTMHTLEVIHKFAEANQVILFTCHPQTVEMTRQAASDVNVIEL